MSNREENTRIVVDPVYAVLGISREMRSEEQKRVSLQVIARSFLDASSLHVTRGTVMADE